jgi:hypothetical protein
MRREVARIALVRGRKIFGGVQAYGDIWRAGANVNTTIEFSDPVSIEATNRQGHLRPALHATVRIATASDPEDRSRRTCRGSSG